MYYNAIKYYTTYLSCHCCWCFV